MMFKSIFSGRLEFGTPRSFEQVLKMFEHRRENYYKAEVLFKSEDIFREETSSVDIPRFITQATEKNWRNTVSLLEQVAQFAVAGDLSAWMTDNGKVLMQSTIEPQGDKAAVQAFIQGRELMATLGKENEAMEALNRAIEKFERHALAYERRGYINLRLRNYEDALYDFNKSIYYNAERADAYFGRAFAHIAQNNLPEAIADFESATKFSIPLQPIYWKARRIKAECLLKIEDFKGAATDLKFVTQREFNPTDSNFKWRRKAFFHYGKALLALNEKAEAYKAFQQALAITEGEGDIADADIQPLLEKAYVPAEPQPSRRAAAAAR